MNKQKFNKQKTSIIKELAKLENKNWTKDDDVSSSIFPYVLMEAINILKNSEIIDNPIDYTKTGEDSKKMIEELLKN